MTHRRRLLLLAPLAIVLVLAGMAWLLLARPTAITSANAAKIQPGMTLAEVEAILGGPARDETTGPVQPVEGSGWDEWFRFSAMDHAPAYDPEAPVWKSDQMLIQVILDDALCVRAKDQVHVQRVEQSVFDMLRRCVGL